MRNKKVKRVSRKRRHRVFKMEKKCGKKLKKSIRFRKMKEFEKEWRACKKSKKWRWEWKIIRKILDKGWTSLKMKSRIAKGKEEGWTNMKKNLQKQRGRVKHQQRVERGRRKVGGKSKTTEQEWRGMKMEWGGKCVTIAKRTAQHGTGLDWGYKLKHKVAVLRAPPFCLNAVYAVARQQPLRSIHL